MKRLLVIISFLISITSTILADERVDSLDYYYQLYDSAYSVGDYEKACDSFNKLLITYRGINGDVSQDTLYAHFEREYGKLCYKTGNYEAAIQAATNASIIFQTIYGDIDLDYASAISDLALYCFTLENYEDAILFSTKVTEITKTIFGATDSIYVCTLGSLAEHYSASGNQQEAIRIMTEAIDIIRNTLGTDNHDYVEYMSQLAGYYDNEGDHIKAIQLQSEAVELFKQLSSTDNLVYASSLRRLAHYYADSDSFIEAIKLQRNVSELFEKTPGIDSLDYALSLSTLAFYFYNTNDPHKAIHFQTKAMEIIKRVLGENHSEYATSMSDLASYYADSGNFNEAIKLQQEATDIHKKISGSDNLDYALSLSLLARYYGDAGNYIKAIMLQKEAVSLIEMISGSDNLDYALSLMRLEFCYEKLGIYDEAILLTNKAKDIIKNNEGIESAYYATSLDNLGVIYSKKGDNDLAIQLKTEALEIRKKTLGVDDPIYATSLSNLAVSYAKADDINEAIKYETEAMEIRKNKLGVDHLGYAYSLNNLAGFYSETEKYNDAIRLATEALEIRKLSLGTEHPEYAASLCCLASFYSDINNYDAALPLFNEYISIIRKNVLKTFIGLSANERQQYWEEYSFVLNHWMPSIIASFETSDAASILYDNTALFAKGLLLSTELEMTKLIQESGDDEVQRMYTELRGNRQILNMLYSKPIAERRLDCDSLERASNDLERQINSRVKEIGNYTRNLNITWQDVQSKLKDLDLAIEFISYQENDSTTTYAALTLCKNDTAPVLTPLFTDLQLIEAARDVDTYQNAAVDELIWKPLASRLEDKSNVYFSASGMLHNIGIEYLPSMNGKECYRLSSTRELVIHKPSQTISSATTATIFGGINYDASYDSIESSAPIYVKDYIAMNTVRGWHQGRFDYRSLQRYGVSPLPGSHAELKEISTMLKKLHVNCDSLSGTEASEESFKALSGQRKSLLHISTHGFYHSPEETENLNDHLQRMLIGNDRPTNYEDQSLLRCWLCFAGANLAISDTLPDKSRPTTGQDDGILSALEIAQTDLRGLDMVVLSACQTALGDVVDGEGVFGLQRGFKKAGAQSILMSLWEVDDEVTHIFMTEFYRGWTSGMTKTEALRNAQSIVKAKYPDPQYWAAFILLDALD